MSLTVKDHIKAVPDNEGLYLKLNDLLNGLPINTALNLLASYLAKSVAILCEKDKLKASLLLEQFSKGVYKTTLLEIDRQNNIQ